MSKPPEAMGPVISGSKRTDFKVRAPNHGALFFPCCDEPPLDIISSHWVATAILSIKKWINSVLVNGEELQIGGIGLNYLEICKEEAKAYKVISFNLSKEIYFFAHDYAENEKKNNHS